MTDTYNPGVEPVAQTANPNVQTEMARQDPEMAAGALLRALGTQSTQQQLAQFSEEHEQRKLQEQTAKVGAYTQQFMQDHESGAVSQTQVKQQFPEMVPLVAARVAESIGKQQGATDFQAVIDQVNNDDSLRLDTGARQKFLADQKAALFSKAPPGNEFYASGVANAMDAAVAQNEGRWQGQTAQYHTQVQTDALGKEVTDALNKGVDFHAALDQIDANWGASSSLNNVERNRIYVDQVIKQAAISDNPELLKAIPDRYLNTDTKAQLYKANIAIVDQRWAVFDRGNKFAAYQREQQTRANKIRINTAIANGQDPNPAEYLGDPEAHAYAVEAMTQPRVPPDVSAAARAAFTNSVLNTSTMGRPGSLEDMTSAALHTAGMNPQDKAELVKELPGILDGRIALKDERVASSYSTRIGSRLEMLSKGIPNTLSVMSGFGSMTAQARVMYDTEIRNSYSAYYQSNGQQWPKGKDAQDLIDSATDRVSTFIDHKSSLDALSEMGAPAASPHHAPPAVPVSPTLALPKGVTKIN